MPVGNEPSPSQMYMDVADKTAAPTAAAVEGISSRRDSSGCNNKLTAMTFTNMKTPRQPPPYSSATSNPIISPTNITATKSKFIATNNDETTPITEESAARVITKPNNNNSNTINKNTQITIKCPDEKMVHLNLNLPDNSSSSSSSSNNSFANSAPSFIIFGRGKHGIPTSAQTVSMQACVLRIVAMHQNNQGGANEKQQYALELGVLGSQPCRVNRRLAVNNSSKTIINDNDGGVIYVKSLSQIVTSSSNNTNDLSWVAIEHGDIIEPYERPIDVSVDQARGQGAYHPFQVSIINTTTATAATPEDVNQNIDIVDGLSFLEASRKINNAATDHTNDRYSSNKITGVDMDMDMQMEDTEGTSDGNTDRLLLLSNNSATTTVDETPLFSEASGRINKAATDHTKDGDSINEITALGMDMQMEDTEGIDGNKDNDRLLSNNSADQKMDETQDLHISGQACRVQAGKNETSLTVTSNDAVATAAAVGGVVKSKDCAPTNNVEKGHVTISDTSQGQLSNITEQMDEIQKNAQNEMTRLLNRSNDAVEVEVLNVQPPKEGGIVKQLVFKLSGNDEGEVVPYNVAVELSKQTPNGSSNTAANEKETAEPTIKHPKSQQPKNATSNSEEQTESTNTIEKPDTLSSEESSVVEIFDMDLDDPRQTIIELLEEVNLTAGTFATGGSCDNGKLSMPGLVVNGVGSIGLPLATTQAKELAKRCEQNTIVDKTARNTYQLGPDSFMITNPTWNKEIEFLTKKVCDSLEVQAHLKIEARLDKLVLYGEGSFSAPHRESKKEEQGSFGTLVVVLPSNFTGGEIVVAHKLQTETFDQSASSTFQSQYAAFYANCKHKLKNVASGHCLCVVYNLVKVGGYGSLPKVLDNNLTLKSLNAAAKAWGADCLVSTGSSTCCKKIVLMTTHIYTPAGIRNEGGISAAYKGEDAAIVKLLDLAIQNGADIDYVHGTVSFSETGYAERIRVGNRRYLYTWEETTDSELSLVLSNWGSSDINGEVEMVPPAEDYFEDKDSNETFSGNDMDGPLGSRQYSDASAIVIFPRSQRWAIATNNNASRMCDYLMKAVAEGAAKETNEECIKKAESLISCVSSSNTPKLIKCILTVTDTLKDAPLSKKFLTSCLSHLSTNVANPLCSNTIDLVIQLCEQIGWNVAESVLITAIESMSQNADATITLIERISPTDPKDSCDRARISTQLAALASEKIITTSRFTSDATGTANFFIKSCKTKGANAALIAIKFVDTMFLACNTTDIVLPKSIDAFPLKGILDVVMDCKQTAQEALVTRILSSYLWLSCQKSKGPAPRYSYQSQSAQVRAPNGPNLLISAATTLIRIFNSFGWDSQEDFLVKSIEKLFEYSGNSATCMTLVETLFTPISFTATTTEVHGRSRVCTQMASMTFDRILATSHQLQSPTPTLYKRLAKFIGQYCPSCAPRFVTLAKTQDINNILYPLVTDRAFMLSTTPAMKDALGLIAYHVALSLPPRTSLALVGTIRVWSLPNAHLSRPFCDIGFLTDPCQQVKDWKVRKSDRAGFCYELMPLVRSKEVKYESYQPGGRGPYHFRITKLKSFEVQVSSLARLSCTCRTNCLLKQHETTLAKCTEANLKLAKVKELLTPVQLCELASQFLTTTTASNCPPATRSRATPRANRPIAASRVINLYARSSPLAASRVINPYARSRAAGSTFTQVAAKKQKTSGIIDLMDDDDDIQIERSLTVAQAVHKRVEAAEKNGEVVEID